MATKNEMDALIRLVEAATKVNASSERVNVCVDIHRFGVILRISDPIVVAANQEIGSWDWLFYGERTAYFSNDVFSEQDFIDQCREWVGVINGFEGRAVQESSQ